MRRLAQHSPTARLGPTPSWWQWPSLLSLEVPIIAVSWQLLLGRTLGAPPTRLESLLLGLVVWLIYSADRLLDGFRGSPAHTERHRFHVTHRYSILGVWLLVGGTTLGLAPSVLSAPQLFVGTLLSIAMLGYFFRRHQGNPTHHPKELHIALLFALGVAFVPLLEGARPAGLLLFTFLFALLIFLNCAFIALWEEGYDPEPAPFATRHPRLAAQCTLLALALTFGCVALTFLLPDTLPLSLGIASSSLLLYTLDRFFQTSRLGPEALRVLGDAALLSPLIFLLFCV